MSARIKRIYEEPDKRDGYRVLVDRIWPRGISKERAHVDEWAREIAPSTGLRKSFAHCAENWLEFRARYRDELKTSRAKLAPLAEKAKSGTVTLVYSARDPVRNQAVVLAEYLNNLAKR